MHLGCPTDVILGRREWCNVESSGSSTAMESHLEHTQGAATGNLTYSTWQSSGPSCSNPWERASSEALLLSTNASQAAFHEATRDGNCPGLPVEEKTSQAGARRDVSAVKQAKPCRISVNRCINPGL
jgi:hypothetical protein